MVVGYNHNIMYKGEVYHVQTEDSGINNPHIITLLYRGGNILASKKTSYADIVRMGNLNQVVEDLMKEQHKEMLRRLKNAEFDDRLGLDSVKTAPIQQPVAIIEPPSAAPVQPAMPVQTPLPVQPAVSVQPPIPVQAQPQIPVQAQPQIPAPARDAPAPSVPPASDKKQSLDDMIFNFLSAGDDSH